MINIISLILVVVAIVVGVYLYSVISEDKTYKEKGSPLINKLKRKWIAVILSVIIVSVGIYSYLVASEYKGYRERGSLLINKIEKYKFKHSRLPKSIKDLNIKPTMGEGPYYKEIDSLKYIVYFSIGFDEGLTYYSDTGVWKETP